MTDDDGREPERFTTRWVMFMPDQPRLGKGCMSTPTPWWRRIGRQLVPRRNVLGYCLDRQKCWYHRGDWHRANAAAIRYLREAPHATSWHGDPWDDDDDDAFHMYSYVCDRARRDELTGWHYEAVTSLFLEPIVQYDTGREGDYANGQHRTRAMMDAGVRRTVVLTD